MTFDEHTHYAGFWRRFGAVIIDLIILGIVSALIFSLVRGSSYPSPEIESLILQALQRGDLQTAMNISTKASYTTPLDVFVNYLLPFLAAVILWIKFLGTPGKLLLGCKIVDATTGNALSVKQATIRYFAYIVSILPFFLGFIWIAFSKRKQAFHDMIAHSVIVVSANDMADKSLEELERELS